MGTAEQAAEVMASIKAQLEEGGRGLRGVFFACIYLADLGNFVPFNGVYCKSFGVNPPSRVCVGSCPDPDCAIRVECVATAAPRKVLHVQSISLWAPSCIGPYSQASTVGGLLHCAGQIPLEAGSMTLIPGEPAWGQTVRCFESCRVVLDVHRSALRQVLGGLLYVVAGSVGAPTGQALARLVQSELESEGLPSELTTALGVIAVDSLPKGSTVELQLYAEENEDLSGGEQPDDKVGPRVGGEGATDLFCELGDRFSKVMAVCEEGQLVGGLVGSSVVVQASGRAGKHCVVHTSVHLAPSALAAATDLSRDVIRVTLQTLFVSAREVLRGYTGTPSPQLGFQGGL